MRTAQALGEIAIEADAEIVGLGFVIEKAFMGARARLEANGWAVESVAIISSLDDGAVVFAD